MREGIYPRDEKLTDHQGIFAFVLGIVKLAPEHNRYQFGGFTLNYAEQDGVIQLQLNNPKKQALFLADVELTTVGEDTKATVTAQWPQGEASHETLKEVRTAMRKLMLAVPQYDYAQSRSERDTPVQTTRFI